MKTCYKKMLHLLIPLLAMFFLAFALGSDEEAPAMCQLCQNKALVKEAIWALNEDPNNYEYFPELFHLGHYDPNSMLLEGYYEAQYWDEWMYVKYGVGPIRFKSIIAEGDMVAVHLEWFVLHQEPDSPPHHQLAIFRIADGNLVESCVANLPYDIWFGYEDPWE